MPIPFFRGRLSQYFFASLRDLPKTISGDPETGQELSGNAPVMEKTARFAVERPICRPQSTGKCKNNDFSISGPIWPVMHQGMGILPKQQSLVVWERQSHRYGSIALNFWLSRFPGQRFFARPRSVRQKTERMPIPGLAISAPVLRPSAGSIRAARGCGAIPRPPQRHRTGRREGQGPGIFAQRFP